MAASGGSSTSTRAFAQKINKNQAAAEVRRNVSSVFINSQTSKRSSTSSASFIHLASGTVPLTEVVDPLDFEDFILQSQPLNDNEPESSMLEFPDDDIEVTTIPRHCRTVQPSIPKDIGFDSDPHLKDCIHSYTADWSIVNRRYQFRCAEEGKPDSRRKITHSRSFTESLPAQVFEIDEKNRSGDQQDKENDDKIQDSDSKPQNDLHKGSWASSIFDLQSSQPDVLLPTLLDRMHPDEVDNVNQEQRTLSRVDSFCSVFPVQQEEGIERRVPATIPQEHFGQRILVKCLQLKLEIEVEPIFASMALYDLRVKKKISENFYFDMNPEWCRKLLNETTPRTDVSTLSRSAVFSITYPSTDVFLVVKLEKILQQGDISEIAEPYMKDTENPKQREKVRSAVLNSVDRLGKYRMPFAWTAIHLIDIISGAGTTDTPEKTSTEITYGSTPSRKISNDSPVVGKPGKRAESLPRYTSVSDQRKSFHGSHISEGSEFEVLPDLTKFRPVTLTVSSFFKQESDKLKDEDLYKFLADIKRPSSVLKRLKCIPGTLKLDISPPGDKPPYCLTSELQQVIPYPDGQGRPTKEIEEFAPKEVFSPFLNYKNLLYIYPLSVNFSSRGGSARNIAIKAKFMAGEDVHSAVECIFGKSSCAALSTEGWVPVTYHNKSPDFYEEIKVKIPPHLTDQHHLLFAFYHISCSPGKKPEEKDTVETPIGYTWIPALKDGRLSLGEFYLPVSLEKPPQGYSMLSPEVQLPGMKWVEGHKGVFHVAVRAVSSVHTQDQHIHKFLKMCHQIEGRLLSPSRNAEGNVEMALRKSIVDLSKAREEPLVRFLHVILDKLILLLVRPPITSGTAVNIGQAAFESLAQIVHRLHELLEYNQDDHNRNNLLASYVTYVFSAPYCPSPSSTPSLFPGGESNRPVSMAIGSTLTAPLHSKTNLSSSNPQLNASSQSDGQSSQGTGWDSDKTKGGTEGSNVAGNRNSMAESRPGSINVPGLTGSNKKSVHEELALQWAVASGPVRVMAMNHSWFFFELMVKSMAQHLDNTDRFFLPRKNRFPEQFLGDLRALVNTTVSEIVSKNKDFTFVQDLNSSLGFFLYDLLSLLDRGFVFDLIRYYCKEMLYQGGLHSNLAQLRLELLRIICSHEHYVTLNLPFPTALYPSEPSSPTTSLSSLSSASGDTLTPANSMAELSLAFRRQHFVVGLLLSELSLALDGNDDALQCQAIDCIRDLMACHDSDTRYDDLVCRGRVAALYLPILGIVIDALPQLHGYRVEEAEGLHPDVAMKIATSSIPYDTRPEFTSQFSKPQQLTQEATRNLLMGFLWVLKNMDPIILMLWWSDQEPPRLGLLLDVLHLCITQFEYTGRKEARQKTNATLPRSKTVGDKKKLEEMLLGQTGAAHEMKQRHSRNLNIAGISPGNVEPKLRWRKDMTQWRQAIDIQGKTCPEIAISSHIEGTLCAEVNMIVLDTLELIVQTVSESDSLRVIMSGILRVLLHCLSSNQSVETLQNIFNTQRSIVVKSPELLFEEDTELCADLCSRLLNHCSCSLGNIRSQASASLYLLMRQNFESNRGENFARVKMQVTMSLSTLVGTSHAFSEECLRRSLKTIITYAESDYELKTTTFPEQVRELVFNLHMILTDTVKMKEFQEDPEMLVDLMYRIAKGYQNSPDLRLTWLNNMASKHSELNNKAEAALCVVHAAGLVAEYLSMIEDKRFLPVGCVAFERISPNVLEESAVSDDVVSPDEEGICTGKFFSENGLVGLLETAANTFMSAQVFECVNEVFKLLIPILEARRDYKKLANVHNKLSEAFNKIINTEGKRMMGTYFRVGFYGSKFGDLDGEEYVYKEPAITKLPEISHRLQNFYNEKFGTDFFEIIKDSDAVDREKLDLNKAYIQLTYVEPYFDEYEMKDRVTYFDKNYNLRRFMYVTPFTPSGKKRGDLASQYKRKTTLTVANSFPYVKTRISVIHREQIVLNPIEVAIEDMQNRSTELVNAIRQHPPDAKMLQMVLQGSIGTTVNQGPLEIANVFLYSDNDESEDMDVQPSSYSRHHHKLRLAFKEFMKRCCDALHINKALIKSDQRAYQKELERNYHQLMNQLEPFLKNRFDSLRGSIRKKEGSALLRKISMSFNAQQQYSTA